MKREDKGLKVLNLSCDRVIYILIALIQQQVREERWTTLCDKCKFYIQ